MPRKYYNPSAVDMEPLPPWLNTSQNGKAKKAAKDDGETERLKKRGREKEARKNLKEAERMRRYEESTKRKEKMVKKDKRRSEVAKGQAAEVGNHGDMKDRRDPKYSIQGRRQIGDGTSVKVVTKVGRKERHEESKKSAVRKRGQIRKTLQIEVDRSTGKERAREWVENVLRMKTTERCLIGSSWTSYSEPSEKPESEVSDLESGVDDSQTKFGGKPAAPASWPICRFCIDDTVYFPVKKPVRAEDTAEVIAEATIAETANASDTVSITPHSVMATNKANTKKSFKSRIVTVFCSLSRRMGQTM